MRAVGDNIQTASNAAQIAIAKARALQKLKPASGLHAETGDQAPAGATAHKCRRSEDPYQSGADRPVPFRYGPEAPRLNAAFVAQILGQMMPDREPHTSDALAIYQNAPATALLCDWHL
jgi:hypothetical protein